MRILDRLEMKKKKDASTVQHLVVLNSIKWSMWTIKGVKILMVSYILSFIMTNSEGAV